jgi:hypothetical protein
MMIELLRENKRMLDKSIREIERERQGLQTQEKKLIAEIKKVAKQGQMVCMSSQIATFSVSTVFYRHTTPNLYGNLYMGNANFVGKVTLQPIFLMVSTLLQATNIVLTPSYPATAIIISCMFFLL